MSQGEIFLPRRLKNCSWQLVPRQSSPGAHQGGQVISYGSPYWVANFDYQNLRENEFRALSAWLARREGARFTFTAYRPTRRYPAEGDETTLNTGIAISSIDTANSQINLTGLPVNLSAGDMIGYSTLAGGYYCGEILGDAVATGGAATVTVKPGLVSVAASQNVRITEALAEFQIEGQARITEPFDRRYGLQFDARQVERS